MKIFIFFLFPALVFCTLELGKEEFDLDNKKFIHNFTRTLYANSSVEVEVTCGIGNVSFSYFVLPLPCPPLNFSEEDRKKFNGSSPSKIGHNHVETFSIDGSHFLKTGAYLIRLEIDIKGTADNVTIIFGRKTSYLSPKDFPLFIFYSLMCVVYSIYALLWLVLCCCYWKEILRIQFWIGGVIFLGMLEKAMYVGEFDSVRRFGTTTGSMLMAAEIVSSLKRTLSRMLVIIVSLGFGIIKPRLGTSLHKITLVGIVFFTISCADGIVKTNSDAYPERVLIALRLLLSIVDATIFLWIFYSLVKTISLLILRKNLVKLSLYRHFRNVLIFSVLASIAFMTSLCIKNNFYSKGCQLSWDEGWWEDAFWSLLFSIILFAIVVLWRPSANNQRYAYSPLYDLDEDDVDQLVECTNEGLGVSKIKRSNDNHDNHKKSTNNEDDDLKWVEENIPTSMIDTALSNLVESDEEINQKKVEISKML